MKNKKPRFDPTQRLRKQSELISDSKTVAYELRNLINSVKVIAWPVGLDEDTQKHVVNSRVEAFAIHCRALTFFFYGHFEKIAPTEKGWLLKTTDVLATDFAIQWTLCTPPASQVLIHAKNETDKRVAHITTDRREVNQGDSNNVSVWNPPDIISEIQHLFRTFIPLAAPADFDPDAFNEINYLSTLKYTVSPHEPLARDK